MDQEEVDGRHTGHPPSRSESIFHAGVQGLGYLNTIETLGLVVASILMTYLGRARKR